MCWSLEPSGLAPLPLPTFVPPSPSSSLILSVSPPSPPSLSVSEDNGHESCLHSGTAYSNRKCKVHHIPIFIFHSALCNTCKLTMCQSCKVSKHISVTWQGYYRKHMSLIPDGVHESKRQNWSCGLGSKYDTNQSFVSVMSCMSNRECQFFLQMCYDGL